MDLPDFILAISITAGALIIATISYIMLLLRLVIEKCLQYHNHCLYGKLLFTRHTYWDIMLDEDLETLLAHIHQPRQFSSRSSCLIRFVRYAFRNIIQHQEHWLTRGIRPITWQMLVIKLKQIQIVVDSIMILQFLIMLLICCLWGIRYLYWRNQGRIVRQGAA